MRQRPRVLSYRLNVAEERGLREVARRRDVRPSTLLRELVVEEMQRLGLALTGTAPEVEARK